MAGKVSRDSKWRSRVWQISCVLFVLMSGMMSLVLVGLRPIGADERQEYMISERVAQGLSQGKPNRSAKEPAEDWMPSVAETPWQYIVIHHSASESGSVETIHREHLQRKDAAGNPWQGIGYHFVIGNGRGMNDGAVKATFRWGEQIHGAHSGNAMFNVRGIGICLIGNFEIAPPTKAQIHAVRELVKVLAKRLRISRENLVGHAAVKATACPGKHFPLKDLRMVIPEHQP